MQHYHSLEALKLKNSWVTIGSFDGVHLGHQRLIKQMTDGAHKEGAQSVVITFFPHPSVVLRGLQDSIYLTSPQERAELLDGLCVDVIITLKFDLVMAALSAQSFMELLSKHTGLTQLWIGPDFALGRGRQGDIPALTNLGKSLGYQVNVVEPVNQANFRISSRQIRALLMDCKVSQAAEQLGRNYILTGEVIHGDGRGKGLGLPTANIEVWPGRMLPGNGIYATWAVLHGLRFRSVTNVGIRPTFEKGPVPVRVETYILDFEQEIYTEQLGIEFVEFLRPELRFTSIDALMEQINQDIKLTREVLTDDSPAPHIPVGSSKTKS
jgi:riboflavin kinase/FMN adenylyltransferase